MSLENVLSRQIKYVLLILMLCPAFVAHGAAAEKGLIALETPREPGNQELAAQGLVDVTAAPFHADPTGGKDATRAIQAAIEFARDRQMICFFPTGVYIVSDTLSCIQGQYDPATGKARHSRLEPCVLIGSRRGPQRPRIVLPPRSPGYGDPARRKYVVHFWSRGSGKEGIGPTEEQANISMNQRLVNIDVVIGEGNPGAVAVRHRGAQGSGVQDCLIDARNGHTGLEGGCGSGGSHAGVTVLGGRIGLDLRETQPASTIAGITLIGQTEAAILYAGRQSLAAVGVRIESEGTGPVIVGRAGPGTWSPHDGQICLVDSVIDFKHGKAGAAITADRSLYLRDVYVRGADKIVGNPGAAALKAQPEGWTHVREYALGLRPPVFKHKKQPVPYQFEAPAYVDGKRTQGDVVEAVASGSPPADLITRHIWAKDFPSWESAAAANVKEAPFGAKGNGVADDTAALQRAINEREVVYLPKGIYRVTRTLDLRPRTKLVGVAQHLSLIAGDGAPGTSFNDPAHPQPVVRTADDADGETVLAFCGLIAPRPMTGVYALHWRCGAHSIYRAVNLLESSLDRKWVVNAPDRNGPFVLVSGNGGGRWYDFYLETWHDHAPGYRHLLVEGTTLPLHFYQCNPEHARGAANMELRGARYVSIYGMKGEGNLPILSVRDCDHVRLFGYGGNAAAYEGTALLRVSGTPNFLIANAVDSPRLAGGSEDHFAGRGVDPKQWHMIIEQPAEGAEVKVAPMERPVLYRRGEPLAGGAGDVQDEIARQAKTGQRRQTEVRAQARFERGQ